MCCKSTLGNKKLGFLITLTDRQNQSPKSVLELILQLRIRPGISILKKHLHTSQVVWWLRIHLPMQETWV